jgi:selenocysteine-specific elongation factor
MIIALAGHVDHGKTSLVRALTGTDPSRLPDERRRGMTIDLGFANTTLPNGTTLGFVDVPGHERFLGNMLAGVLSIDAALLVVAADDGPMPQTREHLAILSMTGIADLTVVITKIDRINADDLPPLIESVRAHVAGFGYPDATVLAVSSQTACSASPEPASSSPAPPPPAPSPSATASCSARPAWG